LNFQQEEKRGGKRVLPGRNYLYSRGRGKEREEVIRKKEDHYQLLNRKKKRKKK